MKHFIYTLLGRLHSPDFLCEKEFCVNTQYVSLIYSLLSMYDIEQECAATLWFSPKMKQFSYHADYMYYICATFTSGNE